VIDADDNPRPGVASAGLGPPPSEHREVLSVECDHHRALLNGELEQLLVVQPVELALVIRGAHVVSALA
jgi:hypothetical protein